MSSVLGKMTFGVACTCVTMYIAVKSAETIFYWGYGNAEKRAIARQQRRVAEDQERHGRNLV